MSPLPKLFGGRPPPLAAIAAPGTSALRSAPPPIDRAACDPRLLEEVEAGVAFGGECLGDLVGGLADRAISIDCVQRAFAGLAVSHLTSRSSRNPPAPGATSRERNRIRRGRRAPRGTRRCSGRRSGWGGTPESSCRRSSSSRPSTSGLRAGRRPRRTRGENWPARRRGS